MHLPAALPPGPIERISFSLYDLHGLSPTECHALDAVMERLMREAAERTGETWGWERRLDTNEMVLRRMRRP